ncbi:serine/threonine-protein kinase [Nocardiopsis lambiniae]|uniref:non-specific serine/threonine protein kinase n=1 Tax=Nocardiopsis lambiniae TaxID=3075539 RepID=A0ABU2M561_9ACTN|nr:serine/threonine-protein kinase [Nocardiopsis sp. DSM 44743]MDT0327461.1 serine/threonine-protein kinase [Nocardiopsis sp. DSM 44743]
MPPSERIVAARYRLTGTLGSGGMGTVWRAFDPRLEREVAIKEVHLPTGLSDEEQRTAKARMMREARTAARIGHPSVVTVHDVLEEDGTPYIVMALLDGSSLEEVLEEEGPLPPARIARISRALLEALRAAHRAGVVHRDIKPANVMVSTDGERVVITDFGIANLMEGASSSLTGTGMVVGTPEYMAPERLEQGTVAEPSDLWSLGATLYAALSGESPFKRESLTATLSAVMAQPIPEAATEEPLASVINGLLVREPDRRLTAERALELLSSPATGPRAASDRADSPGPQAPRASTGRVPAHRPPAGPSPAPSSSGPRPLSPPNPAPTPRPSAPVGGPPTHVAHAAPGRPAPGRPGPPPGTGHAPVFPTGPGGVVVSPPTRAGGPVPASPASSSRAGLWWGLGGGCLLLVLGMVVAFVVVPGALLIAEDGPDPLTAREPSEADAPSPAGDPSPGTGSGNVPFENEYVSLVHPWDWAPVDATSREQSSFPDILSHYEFDSPDRSRQVAFTVFSLDEESRESSTVEMQQGWEESLEAEGVVRDWERLSLEEVPGLPSGHRGSDMEVTFTMEESVWAEPERWMVWRFLVVEDTTAYYLRFNGRAVDREEYGPVVDEVFSSFAVTG